MENELENSLIEKEAKEAEAALAAIRKKENSREVKGALSIRRSIEMQSLTALLEAKYVKKTDKKKKPKKGAKINEHERDASAVEPSEEEFQKIQDEFAKRKREKEDSRKQETHKKNSEKIPTYTKVDVEEVVKSPPKKKNKKEQK
jgi:hypothetical protein